MMKNKNKAFKTGFKKKIIFSLIILFVFFSFVHFSFAQPYTNQEKIPGAQPTQDFVQYLKDIINFGFAVIGILALFMLIIGAYQYLMAAGNIGKVDSAKETIGSALLGLILGLCAYIILYKINPDLVNMRAISQITGGAAGTGIAGQPAVSGTTGNYPTTKSCQDEKLASLAKQYASGFASSCRLLSFASAESGCNPQVGKNPDSSASTMFQVTDGTARDCGIQKGVSLEQDFQLAACVINMKYKNCVNSPNPEYCTQRGYRGLDPATQDPKWLSRYNSVAANCASMGLAFNESPMKIALIHTNLND